MAKIKSIIRTDNATGRVVDALIAVDVQVISEVVEARPRIVGLGDLAATFAKPIAAAIDAITERMLSDEMKTELENCPACARRHRKWNLVCPDVLTCPKLATLLKWLPDFARKALLEAAAKHAQATPPPP